MGRSATTCAVCSGPILRAVDVDTQEVLLVDAAPVDEGHVDIWVAGGRAAARRHGTPSRRQPAHQLHTCHVTRPTPLPDPYAPATAAAEQHGGWRA